MLFGGKKIEDLIIRILKEGPLETIPLILKVWETRPNVTKQAIYKSLRELKKNEVIVKNRMQIALSSIWIKRLADFVQNAQVNYTTEKTPGIDFLTLKEGERVSYSFKTFDATDVFWGHAFSIFSDITPPAFPVFIYDPHEWFLLARGKSELFLFEKIKKSGRKLFLLAGNKDPLDMWVQKYFNGVENYYRMETGMHFKENYYVNVFGAFLIEAFLDKNVSHQIGNFYKTTKVFDASAKEELKRIILTRGKNKLIISKNKRKADTIRRIFEKRFLVTSFH